MRPNTRPAVRSRSIGGRVRVGPTAVAALMIAMIGIPAARLLASPAYAESVPASVAPVADPFAGFVAEASQRFGVPVSWIRAILHAESGGDVRALSPKGAMGLMQIMPGTWESLRPRYGLGPNPYDPHDNILAGAGFLRELHDRYGSPGFLAAYNAGPGRYEDHLATGRPLPAETRAYLATLEPLIADGMVNHAVRVASATGSWTEAPLFVGQFDSTSAVNPASSPMRANLPPTARRVVDVSALVPHSDGLFVPISARGSVR